MNEQEHEPEPQASLIKRIEDLANILQDSSVGEIELAEDGTEIIIKRQPEERESALTSQQQTQGSQATTKTPHDSRAEEDRSIAIVAPLTGVFYRSPSPNLPPFVQIGDIIQHEQVVALIEAMKVFNEVRAHVSGRLTQINLEGGVLVKKDDILFRVEPL
jgi:acetyl-CoA carboxylase biotin carboxyl carrier protein